MGRNVPEGSSWEDRRSCCRLPADDHDLCIELEGGQGSIRIRDLSLEGFLGQGMDSCNLKGLDGEHRLFRQRELLMRCRLRPVELDRSGLIRSRFAPAASGGAARLAHFLAERFAEHALRWSDQRHAWLDQLGASSRDWVQQTLIHFALIRKRPIKMFLGQQALPAILRARALDTVAGRQVLVCRLEGGSLSGLTGRPDLLFGFAGAYSIHLFQTRVWQRQGREVLLLMPARLLQTAFRQSRRCPVGPLETHLFMRHPGIASLWLRRNLRDVSAAGLAFVFEAGRDALTLGQVLPRLRIEVEGCRVEARGRVRSFARKGAELCCGVELTGFAKPSHAEGWKRMVLQLSHPRLKVGSRRSLRQAWRVLQASRFLDEISPQLRPAARQAFLGAWRRFADAGDLSRYLLLVDRGRTAGIVSASLLYPGTWMPHHFGLDADLRSRAKQILFSLARENLSGLIELLLMVEGMEHFVLFADSNKAWNELLFGKFERRFGDPSRVQVDEIEVWKQGIIPGPDMELGDVRFIPPTLGLRLALKKALERDHSLLERRALALGGDDPELERFCSFCCSKGYVRQRRIRFALDRGRPVAALILETGPDGLNLFGLFDRCWIVPLRAGAEREEKVFSALMAKACEYYRRRDKSEFLILSRPGRMPYLPWPGLRFVAGGLQFLGHRSILPAWKGYIEDLMQMLELNPKTVLW